MRVGIVRSDIGKFYLNDVESRSQYAASAEPAGQSRYFHKPTDAEITAVMKSVCVLSVRGSDTSATVNTTVNNTLRIRAATTASYTVITVGSNAAYAKTAIVTDLNLAFVNAGLPLVASVRGTNQIQIDTTSADAGPGADLEIDSTANGSTLNTSVGFTAGGTTLTGLTLAALKTAVYPTSVTINVANATIVALSTFSLLTTSQQNALVLAIADIIAPSLVETGRVLLSFVFGNLSKLRSTSFQPGGARGGLSTGVAAAIVANDGSTVFSI